MAGITFGQQIATELLACYVEALKTTDVVEKTSFLMESAERVLIPFWSKKLKETKQTKFLHNGLYPCYSIYRTQDNGYICLAAVEEKFWTKFCQLFELDFSPQDRFKHDSDHIFSSLENLFSSKSTKEIEVLAKDQNICLTVLYLE